jgi:hypothetical protein
MSKLSGGRCGIHPCCAYNATMRLAFEYSNQSASYLNQDLQLHVGYLSQTLSETRVVGVRTCTNASIMCCAISNRHRKCSRVALARSHAPLLPGVSLVSAACLTRSTKQWFTCSRVTSLNNAVALMEAGVKSPTPPSTQDAPQPLEASRSRIVLYNLFC